jgi:hypothetical protein
MVFGHVQPRNGDIGSAGDFQIVARQGFKNLLPILAAAVENLPPDDRGLAPFTTSFEDVGGGGGCAINHRRVGINLGDFQERLGVPVHQGLPARGQSGRLVFLHVPFFRLGTFGDQRVDQLRRYDAGLGNGVILVLHGNQTHGVVGKNLLIEIQCRADVDVHAVGHRLIERRMVHAHLHLLGGSLRRP